MKRIIIGVLMALSLAVPATIFAADSDHEHDWEYDWMRAEKIDAEYHTAHMRCWECGAQKDEKEEHFYESAYECEAIDNTYHGTVYECEECGARTVKDRERHYAEYPDYTVKAATLTSKGKLHYTCDDCGSAYSKEVSWKRNSDYSASYDIVGISAVYQKSRTVTIKLERPVKGATLKVRIGRKTYNKKITNNKKKVKIKIRKTPYGSKIVPKLYYKGTLVGTDFSDDWDRVLYAKKIRKGMTKKQVKYTYEWGSPQRTASSSGGWTYWYYDDGSWIDFKNGKVKFWYNATK